MFDFVDKARKSSPDMAWCTFSTLLSKRRSSLLPCTVLAATLLLAPASALGKKVVVLDFDGVGNKLIRKKVADKLAETHELVSPQKVASEAKKLGLGTECNETNIMGVASVFSAEGVICGEISGPKSSRKLKISINNGGDAQEVASFIVPVGKWGLDATALTQVKTQADAALAKTWSWDTGGAGGGSGGSGPAVDPEPEPEPEPEPVDETEPEPPPPPPPESGDEEATEEPTPDPAPLEETGQAPDEEPVAAADDVEDPLAHSKPKHMARKGAGKVKKKEEEVSRVDGSHAFRLAVGPVIRLWRFYDPQGVDPNVTGSAIIDAGYKPGYSAGLAIDSELFPGAWFSDGLAGCFGIGVQYSFVSGPAWNLQSNKGNVAESHQAINHLLAVNARFRYHLFENPYIPIFTLKFGYHLLKYNMNDTDAVKAPFPDMTFSSLDVGLALDQALWVNRLHLHGYFSYLPVLGLGEMTSKDFFGPTTGMSSGLAMGGGFRGNIWGPVGLRLEVSYLRYTVSTFEHQTAQFTTWVSRVRDQYLNGMVYLTFVN